MDCTNTPMNRETLSQGLREIMTQVNQKRLLSGADMRFFGIQLNKIEPCNVVLFTAQS